MAESLDMQRHSLRQAGRNINDGLSAVQVAEGAAREGIQLIKRMREIAIQAANGTVDSVQRVYLQNETDELGLQALSIVGGTEFNGFVLANGSTTNMVLQIGIDNATNDRLTLQFGDMSPSALGINGFSVLSQTSAQAALTALDLALTSVTGIMAEYGEAVNRLGFALNHTESYSESLNAAESRVRDADFAVESAEMVKNQIMSDAATAALAQANQISRGVIKLL